MTFLSFSFSLDLSRSVLYIIPPDGKPTMPLLLSFPGNMNITQQIGTTSTVFGTFLLNDDNQERVTALAKQFGNDTSEVNMAILREWLQGSGVKPVTWGKLVEVLKKCRLDELAEKIESHFKCKLHTSRNTEENSLGHYGFMWFSCA